MTECNAQKVLFSSLGRRRVEADFDGGRITSDAGALLLREAERRIELVDAINRAIPDPRDPVAITHDQRTLLAQRVFAIASGYEDLNDHHDLRRDLLFQSLTDRPAQPDADLLASPSTLCRVENRVDRQTLARLRRRVRLTTS